MRKVGETTTPVTVGLLKEAVNSAAFGDGQLLSQLMELMMQLMPFIMGCFPAKAAFVDAAKDPTWFQQMRLLGIARRQARTLGVGFRERRQLSEAAANLMITTAADAAEDRLAAAYDELAD